MTGVCWSVFCWTAACKVKGLVGTEMGAHLCVVLQDGEDSSETPKLEHCVLVRVELVEVGWLVPLERSVMIVTLGRGGWPPRESS